jgi:large subunit ribosomal protein L17
MRHRNAGRKLGRDTSHRKALFRNLITSLFENERIQTTDAKAKAIRRLAEKLITLGKRQDLHARRQALAYVRKRAVVSKLFSEISLRYAQRPGGYTRILKLGNRRGDNAPLSILELVQESYVPRVRSKASHGGEGSTALPDNSKA